MDPKKARAAYPQLFNAIRAVIYRHDPSGLFALGAPKDEHDDDVHRIISRLQHVDSPDAVPEILDDVMGYWFEENPDPKDFARAMAPPIWDAWCVFIEEAG